MRILIVDDFPPDRENLVEDLKALNHETLEVTFAKDSMMAAGEYRPDMVVMDITMAATGHPDDCIGLVAGALIWDLYHIPILYFTDHHEFVADAKQSGRFGYLLKNPGQQEVSLALEMAMYSLLRHCLDCK